MGRAGQLEAALAARGAPRLAGLEWHESLVSTNDRLKDLARRGAPEWTVVAADRQTSGRGREGRAWESPAGGLYLSLLLRPRFEAVSLVPLAAGLAVAGAAEEAGCAVQLKWPNDVQVAGRKLAGILAEAASGPAGLEWIVVGIGVNVALDRSALPEELRGQVASLSEEAPATPSVVDVAAAVLAHLARWCAAVVAEPASVVRSWRSRSVPWWGERVVVRTGGEDALRGRLVDVDGDGALVLEDDARVRRRVLAGDVLRLRREEPA
jgi:BirA family biotin operon repressor/biotin-[acetyl-CoA-carboxylase] ligase